MLTGLRNPWRFWFDPALGEVWIGDVGQDEVEEIDRVQLELDEPPKNLGWSAFEGTKRIGGHELDDGGELVWPVATYEHGDGLLRHRRRRLRRRGAAGARAPLRLRRLLLRRAVDAARHARRPRGDVRREAATVPQLTHIGTDAKGELVFASGAGYLYRAVPPTRSGRTERA